MFGNTICRGATADFNHLGRRTGADTQPASQLGETRSPESRGLIVPHANIEQPVRMTSITGAISSWRRSPFSIWRGIGAIRAGVGIGICQVAALVRRNPDLEHVLQEDFELKLGVWLAMHEELRSTLRCRAVFDGLAEG